MSGQKKRVIIMGAAGRDFHNFNCMYRGNDRYEVVAFTATQIPDIANRKYPAGLAGPLYPQGIPIHPEEGLAELIRRLEVDEVVFSYSDVSHVHVMDRASVALAAGARFVLLSPRETMLQSQKPVIAVCAVRTGSGKSQTSRYVASILRELGKKVAVVRHPMPYGDLEAQAVQRFATFWDLERYDCTIEEREEYEPHLNSGSVVYAGVDYHRILEEAQREADVILWDGGNNDTPFYVPDLHIVVADPLRAGHERTYHPGETNLIMADVVIINKVDSALPADIEKVKKSIQTLNPCAQVVEARSTLRLEGDVRLRDRTVVVVEDGPTITHGGMPHGAGYLVAEEAGAVLLDPRPYAVGSIRETFRKYSHIGRVLPAMGYSPAQIAELRQTIESMPVEVVVAGTPIDLGRVLQPLKVPVARVKYELDPVSGPSLRELVAQVVGL